MHPTTNGPRLVSNVTRKESGAAGEAAGAGGGFDAGAGGAEFDAGGGAGLSAQESESMQSVAIARELASPRAARREAFITRTESEGVV